MAKSLRPKTPKPKQKKHTTTLSPLNSSVVDAAAPVAADRKNDAGVAADSRPSRRSGQGERAMSASNKSEEAALTAMLFGGDGGASGSADVAWEGDDDEGSIVVEGEGEGDQDLKGDLFAIDRSGEEVTDDPVQDDYDDNEQQTSDDNHILNNEGSDDASDEESEDEEKEENKKAAMTGAAWHDSGSEASESEVDGDSVSDDESSEKQSKQKKGVSLADGPNRLKKLRRYRDETDPLSVKEYELRLRERFMNTASVAANTNWADVGLAQKQELRQEEELPVKKKKRGYASSSDDDSDDEYGNDSTAKKILQSNASLFETDRKSVV